jgi:hypothetical protein
MSRIATMCLPAARALHDRHGPARALAMIDRIARAMEADPNFSLVGAHAFPDWREEFEGVLNWRRKGTHLYATTSLVAGATIGDGLIVMPPGSLPVETVLALLPGRPVTDLLDHPLLDASMTITAVNGSDRVQCWISVDGTRTTLARTRRLLGSGGRP